MTHELVHRSLQRSRRWHVVAMAMSALLRSAMVSAQTLPTTNHPPVSASTGERNPSPPLPPGHPPIAADTTARDHGHGIEALPGFRHVQLPEEGVFESPDLPPGVVLVRVVDANGNPVPGVNVRLGSMRQGESHRSYEIRTRSDGVAQFEGLPTGTNFAYRASIEHQGARFVSQPFQISTGAGARVQIVRFDVEHEPRSVLISDARVEIAFRDDRLVVVQRASLVNFSNMSLTGQDPRPVAYVPAGGLRFRLPAGYSAFRAEEEMSDVRITEENGYAVVRGTFPPTGPGRSIAVAFQYHVKLESENMSLSLSLPALPVLRATVVSQAPPGMRLEVEGFAPAEERHHEGQRILITGRQRQSREDPAISEMNIRLSGIPSMAGPERTVAVSIALALVFGSLVFGLRQRSRVGMTERNPSVSQAKQKRLLAEAVVWARAYAAGTIGPETHARRRRELIAALARVLAESAPASSQRSPQ